MGKGRGCIEMWVRGRGWGKGEGLHTDVGKREGLHGDVGKVEELHGDVG